MKTVTTDRKIRRKRRVSSQIMGTKDRPRIAVFRSNRYTYVQAIDDEKRNTIAHFSTLQLKKMKDYQKGKKTEDALRVALELAKILKAKKTMKAVFDRNVYAYKGRVKAIAEGLRKGGIEV